MARIVPSAVVHVIEAAYPWAAEILRGGQAFDGGLSPDQAPSVSMVLSLAEQIPPDLLPRDARDHAVFVAVCGAMRGALMSWSGGGHPGHAARLTSNAAFGGKHPIVAMLDVLRRCPDEAASAETHGLEFISDAAAREDIRVDMSNAHRALGNGEYKAATVLAGGVIEALLLWALKQADPTKLAEATARVEAAARQDNKRAPDKRGAEFWHLPEYVEVALALGAIDETTAISARLAGDYRNLIHPGRVLRTGSWCDQATALAALSAMERIANRL